MVGLGDWMAAMRPPPHGRRVPNGGTTQRTVTVSRWPVAYLSNTPRRFMCSVYTWKCITVSCMGQVLVAPAWASEPSIQCNAQLRV